MATAKQIMLETVEKLNDLNLFEKPLRLKSKTLAIINQTVNAQLAGVDSKIFWGSVDEDIVDVLETNSIELPPEPKDKKKDKKKDKEKKEMSSKEAIPEEFKESAKEEKSNDKEYKKARKAAKKAIKAKLKEVKRLTDIVADKALSKKERKKAKKQLKKLNKEEDTRESTCSQTTTKSTAGTTPKKGAAARAAREIPEKISWPKEGTITQTIVKFLQKKPRTIEQVEKHLEKKFPERPISGMKKTIGAMIGGVGVPLPIHYTKGIPCEVENDGTPEKTIFIPVKE